MYFHFGVKKLAFQRPRSISPTRRWLPVICWALLVGRECIGPPVPFIGPDPADPYDAVPPVSYRYVIAPYVSLRPAKPGNWQQQNQNAASQGEMPGMQMPGMDMPGMKPDEHQGQQH